MIGVRAHAFAQRPNSRAAHLRPALTLRAVLRATGVARGLALRAAALAGAFAAVTSVDFVADCFVVVRAEARAAGLAPNARTASFSASTRALSAWTSALVGTPSLDIARATRSSNTCSSRSQDWVACLVNPVATWLTFPVTSSRRPSDRCRVRLCRFLPSLTSASNTLTPSSCALANAPRPASQICWAEAFTAEASCESLLRLSGAAGLIFLIMRSSLRMNPTTVAATSRVRTLMWHPATISPNHGRCTGRDRRKHRQETSS